MGIEGVEYHYYNEWSDPTVTYKGFTFSEWELTDAIQNWIDWDIAKGDIPKGTTIHEYLENENHHIIVTDILDDFVASQWEVLRKCQYETGKYSNQFIGFPENFFCILIGGTITCIDPIPCWLIVY